MSEETSVLIKELREQAKHFDNRSKVEFFGQAKYPNSKVEKIRQRVRKHPNDYNHDTKDRGRVYSSGLFARHKDRNKYDDSQIRESNAPNDILVSMEPDVYDELGWRNYLNQGYSEQLEHSQPQPISNSFIRPTTEEKRLIKLAKARHPRR